MICSTYVDCVHNCQIVHCSKLWECFHLRFHKGWCTVSYAKGNDKGSIQTSFFSIWRIGTALILAATLPS